jgi:hypothetical protein
VSYLLALVIFGALLAISVVGYMSAVRNANKFETVHRNTRPMSTAPEGAETLP